MAAQAVSGREDSLESVLCLKGLVLLPEGVDSINHLLDELDLAVAQTVLVGDIVGHTWR